VFGDKGYLFDQGNKLSPKTRTGRFLPPHLVSVWRLPVCRWKQSNGQKRGLIETLIGQSKQICIVEHSRH